MATSDDATDYSVTGTKPISIITHTVARDYRMAGIELIDFIDKHTGIEFNISELKREFKTRCEDYMETLSPEVESKAVELCSHIIYEVGPESRKVRKGTGDKVWKFIITIGKVDHYVFVASFKQDGATYTQSNRKTSMIMTLKQAALIVHDTLSRIVEYGIEHN